MTDLKTPHAFPKFCLLETKMYGTFLSSHNKGRCNIISSGSASAAITIISTKPLFKTLVDSFAPFLS